MAIPTHGERHHYLAEAIRGVLAQTLTEIEVYVSNDRSSDLTASVVASFDDPRLDYLVLPPPGGLHANLNACLGLGTAPYLAICQDDDIWYPDNLARLVEVMDRHPDVALAHGAFRWIDADGRTLRKWSAWGRLRTDIIECGDDFIHESMAAINRVNMSSALIRRSALGSERFRVADDVLCDTGLWMRLARRGDVAFVSEPLTALRVHGETVSVRAGTNEPELRGRTLREIELAQGAKGRFLSEYRYRGAQLRHHRRTARRWANDEIAQLSKRKASPDRPFVSILRTLAQGTRIEPTLVVSTSAWRAALGGLLGDGVRSRLRHFRMGIGRSQ